MNPRIAKRSFFAAAQRREAPLLCLLSLGRRPRRRLSVVLDSEMDAKMELEG